MTKRATRLHDKLVKMVLSDPVGMGEYDAFKLQLELAEKLKKTRLRAHMAKK